MGTAKPWMPNLLTSFFNVPMVSKATNGQIHNNHIYESVSAYTLVQIPWHPQGLQVGQKSKMT